MAAMIQQDLAKLGMKLNIVTLDFPSLIARMTRSLDYETCLLGLVNVDIDPRELMSVLLSSASNHSWNPSQKTPATVWEAEIDRLMLALANEGGRLLEERIAQRASDIDVAYITGYGFPRWRGGPMFAADASFAGLISTT